MARADPLSGVLKGPGYQFFLWSVVSQVIGAMLAPGIENLQRIAWKSDPSNPLSPEQAADAVVRNFLDAARAAELASESGTDAATFEIMTHLAGDAPGPEQLAEALRRQVIAATGKGPGSTSFEQGIAEGRLANKWAPVIHALAQIWPTPTDALEALLKGQVTHDEAQQLYARFGGNPDYFNLLYNTQGESPSPVEAARMANRGVIPWDGAGPDITSYAQAFHEGRWKNKWTDAFRKFAEYHPPARTVVAMLRNGSITDEQASTWLREEGAPDDVVAAFLADAHRTKATKAHELTTAAIQQLYSEHLIGQHEGIQLLVNLGYSQHDAELEIQLQTVRMARSQLTQAISRVRSLYTGRKLSKAAAQDALTALHVAPTEIKDLLDLWDTERAADVRVLSEAQIAAAFFYDIIDQATATSMLEAQGYSAHDAWLVLSVRKHSPLPNEPT